MFPRVIFLLDQITQQRFTPLAVLYIRFVLNFHRALDNTRFMENIKYILVDFGFLSQEQKQNQRFAIMKGRSEYTLTIQMNFVSTVGAREMK